MTLMLESAFAHEILFCYYYNEIKSIWSAKEKFQGIETTQSFWVAHISTIAKRMKDKFSNFPLKKKLLIILDPALERNKQN